MSVALTGVQSHQVREFWPFVEDMISDALEESGSDWTADELLRGLARGSMQLWLATSPERQIEAALITHLRVQGETKCVILAVVGEEPGRWLHLLDIVEQWAVHVGCKEIGFDGRRGWERLLPDYRVTRVFMKKELAHG